MKVRVRFAPSPTGYLHIGGLRTALYNYLLARHAGGEMVLRIEDTDRSRYVEDAVSDIMASLEWAGLRYDEGPDRPGSAGPYFQSQRTSLYHEHVQPLVASGFAYYAFDTPEELEAMRNRENAPGGGKYDAQTRLMMRNGLTLAEPEVQRLLAAGAPRVVRLKVPAEEQIIFRDLIRGEVRFDSSQIDDQILIKSDGMPTYHLANVVDDHLMGITHVVRGEEWLPSTPKHMLLYRFLGWDPPEMAHLPLILSPSGGKLSKRSADREGIPVLVRDYVKLGYEAAALLNYLAFLGWNPGTEQEVFSLDGLAEAFTLDRVGSSGVQFSLEKLEWYSAQHLRSLTATEIATRARSSLDSEGLDAEPEYLERVVELMRDRITRTADLVSVARYFFEDPEEYEEKGVRKRWGDDSAHLVTALADRIAEASDWDAARAERCVRELAEAAQVGAGRVIHPARLALSGVSAGPGLFELMEILGRDTCSRRLRTAAARLS